MSQTDRGLLLPAPPRRAWLRSFWLVVVGLVSALSGVVLAALVAHGFLDGAAMLIVWALASSLAGTAGVICPPLSARAYSLWNRVAAAYLRAARFAIKCVCFWVILTPLGWTRAGLVLTRPEPGKTMWIPRKSIAPTAYGAQHDHGSTPPGRQSWIRAYVSWAGEFENAWALVLLPFLLVLGSLEAEDEANVPTQTYTLF